MMSEIRKKTYCISLQKKDEYLFSLIFTYFLDEILFLDPFPATICFPSKYFGVDKIKNKCKTFPSLNVRLFCHQG